MLIIRSLDELKEPINNAVVTIGNFDGVHLGHREIFRRTRTKAATTGGSSVVVTFVPHPLKIFSPWNSPRLITTYAEKEGLIESSGLDYLISVPFTREFAALSAPDFVDHILVELIGMKALVIGYDYAFGRNREGDVSLLRKLAVQSGFELEILPPVGAGSVVYSSTSIRERVAAGDVKGVIDLLGRHYFIDGTVVHGHHRGRVLGFPTANINTENELIPQTGVYAVKVRLAGQVHDGACNIGSKPTFDESAVTIEIFIFDFATEIYGEDVRVYFIERIRDEQKFADISVLQQAIQDDVLRCQKILSSTAVIESAFEA